MSNTNSPTRTVLIVGFGIAGQLLLLELLKAGIKGSEITVVDKTFLGGDLVTHYGTVLSNTPWWKTKKALEAYPDYSAAAIAEGSLEFQDSQCMPVARIAELSFSAASKALKSSGAELLATEIQSIHRLETNSFQIQHTFGSIRCKVLFATQGAEPKRLPLEVPTIPLSIALDKQVLSRYVSSKDTVAVIGTAHSGSILLQHLHSLAIPTIAFYKGAQPFRFARNGTYDGLKECSEQIADAVLRGEYTNLTLVSLDKFFEAHTALKKATKVIVATGFEARQTIQGLPITYNPTTAALEGWQSAYGFGIAYPGTTTLEGKTYVDVSVLSFQEQIQRCLPGILQDNKDKLNLQ